MRWTLMLGLLAMTPATAATPVAATAGPAPAQGMLLYAAPHMGDPNFGQTVVLLVHYGRDDGAQGLVVNSPTAIRASEALPEIDGVERLSSPVFYGGPVQPERVLALVRSSLPLDGALRVFEDVQFTARRQTLEQALGWSQPARRLRLFVGYAGWAPRQLEGEIARGDWLLERADPDVVFTERPEEMWQRVYQLQERIEVRRSLPRHWRAALDPFRGAVPE